MHGQKHTPNVIGVSKVGGLSTGLPLGYDLGDMSL